MRALVFALLAGLCWGIGELFTKSVLHSGRIGPVTLIALRSTVALPVLWIAWAIIGPWRRLEPTDWTDAGGSILAKATLGSGLLAGAGGMLFFYLALGAGEVSRVKPIAFTVAPASAVLLAALFLGEPLTPRKALAVGLVLAGVVLLAKR